MDLKYQKLLKRLDEKKVLINEPLAKYTYFKIGGPADLFYSAYNQAALIEAVEAACVYKIPYFILGGGSNILVSDLGFRGLVIKNRTAKIGITQYCGKVSKEKLKISQARVTAESGVITNLLVRRTIQEGLAGLEYFLGIPGTVGGAIYNNSHYQREFIGNYVETVTVIDGRGMKKVYKKNELKFKYDYSLLQKTKEVIISVSFNLEGGNPQQLWREAESYAKTRSESQPLTFPSSGCIFKNVKLAQDLGELKAGIVSSGYLIDKAGLKGKAVGDAQVSAKHANFIINKGKAQASDVLCLIELIKKTVHARYGINLKTEVFKIGEF